MRIRFDVTRPGGTQGLGGSEGGDAHTGGRGVRQQTRVSSGRQSAVGGRAGHWPDWLLLVLVLPR